MIALLLARWRWAAGAAVLAVVAGLWLALRHEHALRERGEEERAALQAQAEAQARAAVVQSQVDRAAGAAALRAEAHAADAAVRSEESADEIRSAPGAETPLPEPVRRAWLAGLGRLREPDAGPAAFDAEPG
jgi:hypothetical protein